MNLQRVTQHICDDACSLLMCACPRVPHGCRYKYEVEKANKQKASKAAV
jgi:hypothetical protein